VSTDRPTAATTRGDVQWVGFVVSSVGTITWGLNTLVFHGSLPAEVAGLVQYGVPLGLGWLAAETRWRTARRRGVDHLCETCRSARTE
jgi:hypothetical protein